MKRIEAIILNDKDEVCHRIDDVAQMALGRNETIQETKAYIVSNYREYNVVFRLGGKYGKRK